ncbi:Lrp/AsnC family transcriptional regulator [Haloquadratum walsbyi]|jgi:transcriptional regulator, AsnC family|uniref:siroheme decarboxylase n=1 Tax=Haloquadratum walsbyi J07HQW2 TaxID=1238425 RepID=U1NET7_9EURY|nr:Lrp/AsnC family transcriptional regulator [Haloquadratum walsbyi]ERG95550.1 MAG: transcriptional regulator [Haloquadratum walsbyi J07HQW2]
MTETQEDKRSNTAEDGEESDKTDDITLSTVDRAIINGFQGGFPVIDQPFEFAAAALADRGIDIAPEGVLNRIQTLNNNGVLSRFGALVNAEEIGGTATLVAMHAPQSRFDAVAEAVNDHHEVAHNYEREHPHLNMWFVVSVADATQVERVLNEIEQETGQETYNMPKQQEFRVEAKFLVDGPIEDGDIDCSNIGPTPEPIDRQTLTPAERDLIVEIQEGLPVTKTPYRDVADAIDADPSWVIETIARFNREGKIRRVGVVPNHYSLGYTENGMTVWDVPDTQLEAVGPAIASLPFVTHCYHRPRHEDVWSYNFFAMTHGRSVEESERRIQMIRERMSKHWEVTDDDWDSLFSTQILKKTGIRLDERATANTA